MRQAYPPQPMRVVRRLMSLLSAPSRPLPGPGSSSPPPSLDLARVCAATDRERAQHAERGPGDLSLSMPEPTGAPGPRGHHPADGDNARFWNDLCGSQLAKSLGVRDRGPESLARFDRWYLDYYPYLDAHVRPDDLRDARTLEVGLGYGTVAERIARHGADYVGLDVAAGPVDMVQHRLRQAGLPGSAVQGSILDPPFDPASFDAVIAIGCLHHTGDLARAILQCRRLLRPGGRLTLMVYYAYSYRQAASNLEAMVSYALAEASGYRGVLGGERGAVRAAYDTNASGEPAPHTDFVSRASLRYLCGGFDRVELSTENIDGGPPFRGQERAVLLRSEIPSEVGLDLYASAFLKR